LTGRHDDQRVRLATVVRWHLADVISTLWDLFGSTFVGARGGFDIVAATVPEKLRGWCRGCIVTRQALSSRGLTLSQGGTAARDHEGRPGTVYITI
jgi:hypothetical protein